MARSSRGPQRTRPARATAEDAFQEIAQLCWALAHPVRARIVRLLRERNSCLCGEIAGQLPLAQSTVSQHLKILKESGLIDGEVSGPRVCYGLNRRALQKLKKLVADL